MSKTDQLQYRKDFVVMGALKKKPQGQNHDIASEECTDFICYLVSYLREHVSSIFGKGQRNTSNTISVEFL